MRRQVSYQKTIELVTKHLEIVKKEVSVATRTKWKIKEDVRNLEISFRDLSRDLLKAAKLIGMIRSPDVVEHRLLVVQQQQQQQQQLQFQQMKKTSEEMKKSSNPRCRKF